MVLRKDSDLNEVRHIVCKFLITLTVKAYNLRVILKT